MMTAQAVTAKLSSALMTPAFARTQLVTGEPGPAWISTRRLLTRRLWRMVTLTSGAINVIRVDKKISQIAVTAMNRRHHRITLRVVIVVIARRVFSRSI